MIKKHVVHNATEAHGWIGVIISVVLFLVFWAGSLILFFPEIQRWAEMPHFQLDPSQEHMPLNDLLNKKINEYSFDNSRRLNIALPHKHSPYVEIYMPVHDKRLDSKGLESTQTVSQAGLKSKGFKNIVVHPVTGETLSEDKAFRLMNFMYGLHYYLKLPYVGRYLVGVVSLFFMVIIFTGIVIQLKNLVRHFFLYRHEKKLRYRMNDLHTVIGVVSLPYAFMYALTGLMFNLGILFQIFSLFVLFDGDQKAMEKAAGFAKIEHQLTHEPFAMPNLNELIDNNEKKHGINISRVGVLNYGDKNAIVRLNGKYIKHFAKRFDAYYQVKTADFPPEINLREGNAFPAGLSFIYSLHFANFAKFDVRFLYFILGIGVCIMIIAGNILWLAKRQKKYQQYRRSLVIVRASTLGACVGSVVATALLFLLERVLPVDMLNRGDVLELAFWLVLFAGMLVAFFVKKDKPFIAQACLITAALLLLTLLGDVFLFGAEILYLNQQGYHEPLGVSIGIAFVCAMFVWVGRAFNKV